MVRDELQQFVHYKGIYANMFGELLERIPVGEGTVVAITRCGRTTGPVYLSRNFTRVFGFPRKDFLKGDLQFLTKHIHPDDLAGFIYFAETSTLNARPWKEVKENAVHELCSRFKHKNGKWRWIKQKVIVLSVTQDQHIDTVLLLFDDCTAVKEAELNRHAALVERSRKKSKLLDLLAPLSSLQQRKEKRILAFEEGAALTKREKEIMQLVSEGFSSKEIAAQLFISRHTVESHRKHILRKLSARNAPQMVHQSILLSGE